MKTGKATLKERFVELRADGRSYADIAADLQVSKPTLIGWAKELSMDIGNAKAMRRDELLQKYAIAKDRRIEAFGKKLQGIMEELDGRKLADDAFDRVAGTGTGSGNRIERRGGRRGTRGRPITFRHPGAVRKERCRRDANC